MKRSGASIVVETLINHSVTDVFGFPGGQVLPLYDALYLRSDKIRHYITCHEQGAAHAADGYARATGKTGVVIATSGPGATNLVTGIAAAYLDSSPMIAITGNVPLPFIGNDSFQEVDTAGITMPVTKHNYIVKNIHDLEDIICEAFQIANSGRPGPVLIDIPKDIQVQECEFRGGAPRARFPNRQAEDADLQAAASLINSSKRPYIYAGGGVVISGAFEELRTLAETIDAPVGLSMLGLTAMDRAHPRNLGMTGMHGSYAASMLNAEADLIIGVGVRFSDRATGSQKKYQANGKVVHIDIDPSEIDKNITTAASVAGDLKETLPRLLSLLKPKKNTKWMALVTDYQKTGDSLQEATDSFSPKKIIGAVKKFTNSDTIIATDVGQHQMWVSQYYAFSKPRTFLTSGGLGAMGFGLGAALGASVAGGRTRTVLFTGDGSFHMNMNEMATAVMHKLPVVVVVMNNHVLGMVRQWQSLFYENRFSHTTMDRATDYVKLAEAFGAAGYRAADMNELNDALEKAFAGGVPAIIDCLVDRNERVLPMIPPNGSIEDIITD